MRAPRRELARVASLEELAYEIDPGGEDEVDQTVTFVVTSNTNPLLFSVTPAATLTFTPAPMRTAPRRSRSCYGTTAAGDRLVSPALIASAVCLMNACGGPAAPTPSSPTPPPTIVTANAYILPDAVSRNDWAFGDEPVVVHPGERLRWFNVDTLTHAIVADAPDATDFRRTDELPAGGEQSFVMTRAGRTGIRCAIHPNMTGTLIVRER